MATALTRKVSFLGMGIMGSAMAANLAPRLKAAGNQLRVWNRSSTNPGIEVAKAAGAEVYPHLKDCLEGCDLVFTCLGDERDVELVLTGPAGVSQLAASGAIVVDFSTIGPRAAISIAKKLALAEMHFLDAPVTGGDVGARQGTLTIMVGGSEAKYTAVLPYLEAMGKTIKYCGKTGNGQALKLANQTLCAMNLVGVCEAMTMARDLGLDPRLVVEVLEHGAGGSWSLSNLGRRILDGDMKPGFATNHMLKDLRLAFENLESAERFPGTKLATDLLHQVSGAEGGQEPGTQAMIQAYQQKETAAAAPGGDRISLEWQLDGE